MQTVSARFLAALPNNHQIATRFELWSGIGGYLLSALNIINGSVTSDVANAVRRQLTITTSDPAALTLTPYGSEIRPFRGITYPDGTSELVPLGVLGVTDIDIADNPSDLAITITGADRGNTVARAKFRDHYAITTGSDLGAAIKAGIINQVPALNSPSYFNFVSTAALPPLPLTTYAPGDDPWAGFQKLASGYGYDLYFDALGICNLQAIVDPTLLPTVFSYADDALTSIMARVGTKKTNRSVFNHIIMTSSGTGVATPLRAEAWDSNPSSPTFIGYNYGQPGWQPSPYGDILDARSISTVTTQAQLQAAANAALRQSLGLTQSVQIDALVNPAHLVNDVVIVTRSESGLFAYKAIFDAMTIPFGPDGYLQATLRTVV